MCMSKTVFSFEDGKDYGIGYRAYPKNEDYPDRLTGGIKSFEKEVSIRRGRWYSCQDERFSIPDYSGHRYQAGFHIFLNKGDASRYFSGDVHVVEVHFKDVVAFGSNNTNSGSGPCVIARQMYVVDDRPKQTKQPKAKSKNGRKTTR